MINVNNFLIFTIYVLSLIFVCDYSYCYELKPEEVVKKYYSADSRGVRLSWKTNKELKSLVVWQEEPGWDLVFVIDNIGIHGTKKSNSGHIVEVRYKIIGILNGDDFLSVNFEELVDFVVIKESNSWKILRPIIPPHVSVASLKEHIKYLISVESNPSRNRNLIELRERLDNLVGG